MLTGNKERPSKDREDTFDYVTLQRLVCFSLSVNKRKVGDDCRWPFPREMAKWLFIVDVKVDGDSLLHVAKDFAVTYSLLIAFCDLLDNINYFAIAFWTLQTRYKLKQMRV